MNLWGWGGGHNYWFFPWITELILSELCTKHHFFKFEKIVRDNPFNSGVFVFVFCLKQGARLKKVFLKLVYCSCEQWWPMCILFHFIWSINLCVHIYVLYMYMFLLQYKFFQCFNMLLFVVPEWGGPLEYNAKMRTFVSAEVTE